MKSKSLKTIQNKIAKNPRETTWLKNIILKNFKKTNSSKSTAVSQTSHKPTYKKIKNPFNPAIPKQDQHKFNLIKTVKSTLSLKYHNWSLH